MFASFCLTFAVNIMLQAFVFRFETFSTEWWILTIASVLFAIGLGFVIREVQGIHGALAVIAQGGAEKVQAKIDAAKNKAESGGE